MATRTRSTDLQILDLCDDIRRIAKTLPKFNTCETAALASQMMGQTVAILELLTAEIRLTEARQRYVQQMEHAGIPPTYNTEDLQIEGEEPTGADAA